MDMNVMIENLRKLVNNDHYGYWGCDRLIIKMILDGLDISVLNLEANSHVYSESQLLQLYDGLTAGVDVSVYADPKFDEEQMEEILKGLISGVDVSIYADPDFSSGQMESIRIGLEEGVDVSVYADKKYDHISMVLISDALIESGIDISHIIGEMRHEYSYDQMYEVKEGLVAGIDVSIYKSKRFNAEQMREIREGLIAGVDVSVYADPKFNFDQMFEIREGLETGLDVSSYADPNIDWREMKKIRREMLKSLRAK